MYKKPKRIKKKGSLLKNRFFWLGVSLAALGELLFYIVVLLPLFQIQEVRVGGNAEVSENTIKNVVLHNLWRGFLFFPTASIVLADTPGIQDSLLKALIELDTVSIQRKFPSILSIWVQEKKIVALLCEESGCLALDKDGFAFKKVEPSQDFPIVNSSEKVLESLGSVAVPKDALSTILDFSKEMERRSVLPQEEAGISSFDIVSENRIDANVSGGWSVYFSPAQDLSWQITKLQAVLENKIPPEKRKKLEYIDVRFGDQAYFKYR